FSCSEIHAPMYPGRITRASCNRLIASLKREPLGGVPHVCCNFDPTTNSAGFALKQPCKKSMYGAYFFPASGSSSQVLFAKSSCDGSTNTIPATSGKYVSA